MLSVSSMNPHQGQPVLRGGAPVSKARVALVLIHGRGASAEDIYSLGEEVAVGAEAVALVAPRAAGNSWYPQRFLFPVEQNEPYLGSALSVIDGLVGDLASQGIGQERVVLIGFSQGACLSLEFASRNPRRFGGVIGLSGALIGPPGKPRQPTLGLAGTPVYLGCSDRDAHIPLASVEESAAFLARQGAEVTKEIFPGMGHTVNGQELAFMRNLVGRLSGAL